MEGGIHYTATIYAAAIATIRETNMQGSVKWEGRKDFGRVVNPRGSKVRGEDREGILHGGTRVD